MRYPDPDRSRPGTRAPRVSVVMTAYNDLRFIAEAVDSILAQDFHDFELIVVDDGSPNPEIIREVTGRDARIRLLVNERNIGTAAAANRGIAIARGEIIARLDADDIAEPDRLSRLVGALDDDGNLGLVGSDIRFINEAGQVIGQQIMPRTDAEVRWTMLFYNPFFHSAVAFRRSCFLAAGGYRPEELVSQDHYLWADMAPHCRVANIAAFLCRYRINPQGLTAMNTSSGRRRTHKIREALWRGIGLEYSHHDDAVAGPMIDFLRGTPIHIDLRTDAYAELLRSLRYFRLAWSSDRSAVDGIGAKLFQRMLAEAPKGARAKLRVGLLAIRADLRGAARASFALIRNGTVRAAC